MKAKKTLRQLFAGGQRKSNERSLSGDRVKKALAQKRVYRTASVLACIVAFATTYMLILPAITVEKADVEDQLAGVTVSESVEGIGTDSGAEAAGENADLGASGNANSSEAGDLESGDLLLIADENSANTQAHIGIVVEAVEGSESGQTFSVIEKDPEEGVVLTEVFLEDPTVTILSPEEAAEYPELGAEVTGLISVAQEEEILGAEEAAELEGEVENSLAALGVEMEEEPSAVGQKDEGVIQSEVKDSEEESAVTEEDSSVQVVQDDNGVEEQNDDAVIPDEVKDPEDAKDLEEQTAETGISTELDNDIAVTTYQVANYLLSYTVDFHWDVDGKNYEYNLPGGGFISLTELVEALGVVGDNGPTSLESKALVANIERVEFSSPELLSVYKAEEDTTVGAIKETLGLKCEYSAELTEEQIKEINATIVQKGDWALISLKPFDTDETMTITMNNGDQFVVKVTDVAYSANVINVDALDGKTGALVRTMNNLYSSVQSTALNATHLQALSVTIDTNAGTLSSAEGTTVTQWTFEKVAGTQDRYYIKANNGYLNIGNGSATISSTRQELVVQTWDNKIRIKQVNNNYALNNDGNSTQNGYSAWDGSGNDYHNPGEWFTIYEIEQKFPVTLHFVKEDGTSFTTGEVTYADGTPVEIVNGNFKIDPEKLVIGDDGIIDLNQFRINGYTLSNTHKSTWQDINDSTDDYRHSIIGNELKWNNGTVQYRLFYTNHDKAGSYWFDAGTEPTRDNNHWQYNNGADPSDHSTVPDNDSNPYDYYLVYDPIPTSSGGSSGHTPSGDSIDDIEKSKTLTPNDDGTYTMDLSVTTHAAGHEESNGINLVIVFDTSSSMRRSVNNANNQYGENDFKNHSDSRFVQARNALSDFLNELMPSDNTATNMVQLALVDFNYSATTHTFSGGTGNPAYWTNNAETFMNTINGLTCPSGTNWAQALETAKTVALTADEDPTYILLMTDGAPSQYWDPTKMGSYFVSGEGCYLGARDEARAIVNVGYELYGVFSFGDSTDESNKYLDKLVDYAYNKEVHSDHSYYASNPDKLEEALASIFGMLKEKVAHIGVNYEDGIALDTTSTALSANVGGNLGSITYSKIGGTTEGYTVTTDASGKPTFKIGESTYAGETATITYTKISGSSSEAGGDGITVNKDATATVYKCTVGSGDDAKTYYMPIATLEKNDTTKVGDLNWDLSPLGMMEEGATYKISFVVWPNQEAYDYVAKLNNGLMDWNTSSQEPVYASDGTTLLYYRNGVANYPNIVRYPDGTFAVLTNTMQEVTYYVASENTLNTSEETTYTGQHKVYPVAPDPMPLTASKSKVTKVWNVDRDPGILAQLLYNFDGSIKNPPVQYSFDILMDDDSSTTEDDLTNQYTTVKLGWDPKANNGNGAYDWESDSEQDYIMKNRLTGETHTVKIGTRWTKEFSIATGLMLSEERMDELGLDKSAYPSGKYPADQEDGKTYYILEKGHDYTIKEPGLTYEFDFNSPLYHPMLVDGVLQNVTFTENDSHVTITDMTSEQNGISALVIENTLRGYINLNKVVLDTDGETVLKDDDTKFTYTVVLENSNEPGPFTGDSIPWYGISGLFYHSIDEDGGYHYYQAEPTTSGKLTLTDEDGHTFEATSETFHPDSVGPSAVTYTDGGVSKTIQLYGNQMDVSSDNSDNIVSATLQITQKQTLNIANVPVNTVYTITESDRIGYQLVKIEREIKVNEADENPESKEAFVDGSKTITGTIVANRDNQVTYFNKILKSEITIQKLDEGGNGLSGAIFELKKVDSEQSESYASNIDGVVGLSNISKTINGEQKTFYSSIETTGHAQTISGLPDGTYRLREVYIPDGYVSTYQYVQFDIVNHKMKNVTTDTGDTSKLTFKAADENDLALLQISNTPGAALPSTGGPGTEGFLILGGLLTIGAAVLLIRRKIRQIR